MERQEARILVKASEMLYGMCIETFNCRVQVITKSWFLVSTECASLFLHEAELFIY